MTDYMLRTDIKAQMDNSLEAAGLLLDGIPVSYVSLDRIGPVPAQVDEDGTILRPGDSRYHANIRCIDDLHPDQLAELPMFAPLPTVPYRVFA